ncbi:hypothetical protein BJE00_03055 [Wolbachia sp. wRi]|nr:hypothetical protein BJU59_02870 [Wolbachia sp. wRi_2]POG53281.1 hypothetical protein BJE00_03055 [Wolbachia sp. wRi]QEF50363.1 hypothetical protein EA652_0668 [Wolbachia endosymbiont of Drosophila ananassae]RLT60147.1 hypothetical protein WANA13_0930 [Wolbachia endosymbiont of Drosophila ananassae]
MVETIKDNDVFFKDGGERYKLSYEVYNNVTKNNIIEFSRIIPRMFLCSKRGNLNNKINTLLIYTEGIL